MDSLPTEVSPKSDCVRGCVGRALRQMHTIFTTFLANIGMLPKLINVQYKFLHLLITTRVQHQHLHTICLIWEHTM